MSLTTRINGLFDHMERRYETVGDQTTYARYYLDGELFYITESSCMDAKHYDEAVGRQECDRHARVYLWVMMA